MQSAAFRTSMSISPPTKPQQIPEETICALKTKPQIKTILNNSISFQFKEKILCLELMGIDSGKAMSLNPTLVSTSLHKIHSIISFLQSKGIEQNDLPRIIGMCPSVLSSDIGKDLVPVFDFISNDLKVPERSFRKVVNKCPRLLVSSAKDQLKPALSFLKNLGIGTLDDLAYRDTVLLVSNVENTLIPKMDFLESLGLSRRDVVEMVLRCPGLLTFSIENNFKPKYEYFKEVMGCGLEDLKEFPQYFAFSLEKRIRPRYEAAIEAGVVIPLPLLLKATDDEFLLLVNQGKSDG